MHPTVGWVDHEAVIRALATRMIGLGSDADAEAFPDHGSLLEAMARGPFDTVVLQRWDDLDVLAVLERIRRCWPATRVVLSTAATPADEAADGLDPCSFDAVLPKPFDRARLLAALGLWNRRFLA
jgi:DNA-binding response OmpR family regulator